jgi:GNAT superfamily N-acetyltransferase
MFLDAWHFSKLIMILLFFTMVSYYGSWEIGIAGFIIYQLVGVTLYLRYWFVSPLFRDRKFGSKLFNYFLLKGKDSKRQLFWVIQTNENAISRYKHYGFKEEKIYNFVLTNKNIKYEG